MELCYGGFHIDKVMTFTAEKKYLNAPCQNDFVNIFWHSYRIVKLPLSRFDSAFEHIFRVKKKINQAGNSFCFEYDKFFNEHIFRISSQYTMTFMVVNCMNSYIKWI